MRALSRVRKPNVRARGAATIGFSIAPSGGLSSVLVARSSGSAALDRAALRLVQRAAPFPPPPRGARRNFSIQIQGR
jgi:protein TonB